MRQLLLLGKASTAPRSGAASVWRACKPAHGFPTSSHTTQAPLLCGHSQFCHLPQLFSSGQHLGGPREGEQQVGMVALRPLLCCRAISAAAGARAVVHGPGTQHACGASQNRFFSWRALSHCSWSGRHTHPLPPPPVEQQPSPASSNAASTIMCQAADCLGYKSNAPGSGTSVITSGTTLRRSTVRLPLLPSPLHATRHGGASLPPAAPAE